MKKFALSMAAALVLAACGGGSAQMTSEAPAPVHDESPTPLETRTEAQAPDTRIWDVYWDDIHALRVFPTPGPIRSEDDPPGDPVFDSRSDYFSIVSFYYEKESFFAPTIAQSSSLDALLAALDALELVDIEEGVNPIYAGE